MNQIADLESPSVEAITPVTTSLYIELPELNSNGVGAIGTLIHDLTVAMLGIGCNSHFLSDKVNLDDYFRIIPDTIKNTILMEKVFDYVSLSNNGTQDVDENRKMTIFIGDHTHTNYNSSDCQGIAVLSLNVFGKGRKILLKVAEKLLGKYKILFEADHIEQEQVLVTPEYLKKFFPYSSLVLELIKGNVFEEYDAIFSKAGLDNFDANRSISSIIDLTVCNAGSIVQSEQDSIIEDLAALNSMNLSESYKLLISDLIDYILSSMDFDKKLETRFTQHLETIN